MLYKRIKYINKCPDHISPPKYKIKISYKNKRISSQCLITVKRFEYLCLLLLLLLSLLQYKSCPAQCLSCSFLYHELTLVQQILPWYILTILTYKCILQCKGTIWNFLLGKRFINASKHFYLWSEILGIFMRITVKYKFDKYLSVSIQVYAINLNCKWQILITLGRLQEAMATRWCYNVLCGKPVLTWSSRSQQHNVAFIQFNISVSRVKHIPAPFFLRSLLIGLLLNRRTQSVAMGTDASNLKQLWKNSTTTSLHLNPVKHVLFI